MNLFVSFSAGETSALMTYLILTQWRDQYKQVIVIFANTGQENEETLVFAHRCTQWFEALGATVVWVEAVVMPGKGNGTVHRVVTFETASRRGEPFRAVIEKYGIPNQKFPACTRELKQRPMYSYLRTELRWKNNEYKVAVGIRADEAHRRDDDSRIVYPLLDWLPVEKPDVNTFWQMRSFRLQLAGYQGNCRTCWKKSLRKLLTVMDDDPAAFDFFAEMERLHGHVGPEFEKPEVLRPGYRRVFFRGNMSVADLRRTYHTSDWTRAENDAIIYSGQRVPLDSDDGCVESCEVKWSDQLDS